MNWTLEPVIPPAVAAALDWATVKGHLRLDGEEERGRVEAVLIPAAATVARDETNLQLTAGTFLLTLDEFPCAGEALELPRPPLRTVTSVKYYDADGALQTWAPADYVVSAPDPPADGPPAPGLIYPAYGESWPTPRCQRGAVMIEYTAGYDSAPPLIVSGMLLVSGELFERREEAIVGASVAPVPMAARSLFRRMRVPKFRDGLAVA